MAVSSSAYVTCEVNGKTYTWHFTGVIEIEHNLALNLDNKSSQGADIVNGARNLANQVTLSVVETDVEHTSGWSARMLEAMISLKKQRALCRVVTSMASYEQMLLRERREGTEVLGGPVGRERGTVYGAGRGRGLK